MRKLVVPLLFLLGVYQTQAAVPQIRKTTLAQAKQNEGETPDELTTWSYHFEEITEFEIDEITEYWENRTNGTHCIDIFTQITSKFYLLQEVVHDVEGLIE